MSAHKSSYRFFSLKPLFAMRVWIGVFKCGPVVFSLKHLLESPGEFGQLQTLDFPPQASHSAGLGQEPSVCISNKELLMLLGQGPHFENPGDEQRDNRRVRGLLVRKRKGSLACPHCLLGTPTAIIVCTIHLAINHVSPFDTPSLCLNAIYIFLLGLCLRTRQGGERPTMGQLVGERGGGFSPKGKQKTDNEAENLPVGKWS